MNTMILCFLCDTLVTYDTIAVKCAKAVEFCLPVMKEAETNWQDVVIVGVICLAICVVAWLAKAAVLGWKEKVINAQENERKEKDSKEVRDSVRKLKYDLLDKYLDLLKERAKDKGRVSIGDFEKQRKECTKILLDLLHNEKNSQEELRDKIKTFIEAEKLQVQSGDDEIIIHQYRKALQYLMELSLKDKLNEFSADTLNSFFEK